jgi:hypothetical protein
MPAISEQQHHDLSQRSQACKAAVYHFATLQRAEVANLTPADVERIIGRIEDHDIARVVGTGASPLTSPMPSPVCKRLFMPRVQARSD